MGTTPNPAPSILQAPDNTWWSVSGSYPDGSEFSGAVAFATNHDGNGPEFDVVLGPDWRAVQYGRRAETITAGTRLVLVDGEVPERLQRTGAELGAALAVIAAVREVCTMADRNAPARAIVEQIEALLPPS